MKLDSHRAGRRAGHSGNLLGVQAGEAAEEDDFALSRWEAVESALKMLQFFPGFRVPIRLIRGRGKSFKGNCLAFIAFPWQAFAPIPVNGQAARDSEQPAAELPGRPVVTAAAPRPKERLLEKVLGGVAVACEAEEEGEHHAPMALVELREGTLVAFVQARHQFVIRGQGHDG
jgi:hypothetical protein